MARLDPESIPAQEAPVRTALPLGDGDELRLMDDVTAWASKLKPKGAVIIGTNLVEIVTDPPHVLESTSRSTSRPEIEEDSLPDVLDANEVEAVTRFRDTLPMESSIQGIYKVENPLLLERYLSEKRNAQLEEVYMYHGAPLHILATIAKEGFNIEASCSGPHIFVSSFSSVSLGYCHDGLSKFGPSAKVQISVMERCLELIKQHQEIMEGKAPAFPLLLQPPGFTRAILICKFLVPWGSRKECVESSMYTTSVASRVYPHLLVHIGPNEVAYVYPTVQPLAVQSGVQPAPPIREKPDRCCGPRTQCTIFCLTVLLVILFLVLEVIWTARGFL